MKNITLGFLTIGLITCTSKDSSVSQGINSNKKLLIVNKDFKLQLLEGYFLKNHVTLQDDINTMVFNTKEDFDNYFGIAKTMDSIISPIDFNKERVAGVLINPTDIKIEFSVISVKEVDTSLQIVYTLIKGEKQSFITTPIYLFKIPKNNTLQSIEFVYDNHHSTITFLPTN